MSQHSGRQSAELRLSFDAGPSAVTESRRELRGFLARLDVADELVERALLVASELTTNAVEASEAGSGIGFTASFLRGVLTLVVVNPVTPGVHHASRWPTPGMPPPTADRGRGLPLVASVSARLSVVLEPASVEVRAELIGVP